MKKQVFSASITPLTTDGALDKKGISNILERNIRHGIDGVFILGSMGEWSSFDSVFKEDFIKECASVIRNRIKLLVGINATSLSLSLKNMEQYSKYSFDSYVFMLPGRTSRLNPVKSILNILDASDRSVYYYHCPPNNGITLSLDDFAAIMKHPRLMGIKNSASDMWLRRELICLREKLGTGTLLLEGQEWAVDEGMVVGYDGMICGIGALGSKIMVGIARTVDAGNIAEAIRLQNVLISLFHEIYGCDLANVWTGQKYALMKLGLIESSRTLVQEMDSLTDIVKRRIEKCLDQMRMELD